MVLLTDRSHEDHEDATEDYPESRRALQVVCVSEGVLGRASIPFNVAGRDRAKANSGTICSGCRRKRPGYDRLPPREFEFVPLWGIAVMFLYVENAAALATYPPIGHSHLENTKPHTARTG